MPRARLIDLVFKDFFRLLDAHKLEQSLLHPDQDVVAHTSTSLGLFSLDLILFRRPLSEWYQEGLPLYGRGIVGGNSSWVFFSF